MAFLALLTIILPNIMRKTMDRSSLFKGPAVGLGTWQMGEHSSAANSEVAAIRHALERGIRLIDTAEMYADGESERRVGEALKQWGTARREEITLVTKVLPHHASRSGTVRACEDSLQRLGVDYIDVYLLHWQGSQPFEQTLQAFADLRERGLIRHWGVSNFDVAPLKRWLDTEARMGLSSADTAGCVTNQVYYSLLARGPEFDLLPAMAEQTMPLMAYTPLGSGALASDKRLAVLAAPRGISAAQLALAWVIRSGHVVAIPKSSKLARIDENLAACEMVLDEELLREIDALFPPPARKVSLAMV